MATCYFKRPHARFVHGMSATSALSRDSREYVWGVQIGMDGDKAVDKEVKKLASFHTSHHRSLNRPYSLHHRNDPIPLLPFAYSLTTQLTYREGITRPLDAHVAVRKHCHCKTPDRTWSLRSIHICQARPLYNMRERNQLEFGGMV